MIPDRGLTTMPFLSSSSFRAHLTMIFIAGSILWINGNRARASVSLADDSPAFKCPPGFISFGSSLSDTGNVALALPGELASENLPYGETFFGSNAFRASDGRLVVDFLDLAFGYPLLSPYFESIAPDFRRGVNFAASGTTALPQSLMVPFNLGFQVRQFLRFKQRVQVAEQTGVLHQTNKLLPNKSVFTDGLYILSFGRNDFTFAYTLQGFTPKTIIASLVPEIVSSTISGIQNLYKNGARNFLVFNIFAQGCSPQFLTIFGPFASKADYDKNGCLAPYNEANQVYNSQLLSAIKELRITLNESLIFYFDYYQANLAVLQDPESFGFSKHKALVACCGAGGQYNYNSNVSCSRTGIINNVTVSAGSCSNRSEFIYWDGVHLTDAFNGVIARFLLSGEFLDPPINLQKRCSLDFSKFTGVSFKQAYPKGFLIGSSSLNVSSWYS